MQLKARQNWGEKVGACTFGPPVPFVVLNVGYVSKVKTYLAVFVLPIVGLVMVSINQLLMHLNYGLMVSQKSAILRLLLKLGVRAKVITNGLYALIVEKGVGFRGGRIRRNLPVFPVLIKDD